MKTVRIELEEYLYTFYEKIGKQAARTPEQVMADVLFQWAGEMARKLTDPASPGEIY